MKKNELLDQIEVRRVHVEAWLSRWAPQQLTRPIQASWSFKDILSHLAYWDRNLLDEFDHFLKGEPIERSAEDDDTINARVFNATKDLPLPEVITDFRRTFQRLATFVAEIPEATLNGPSPSDPDQPLWKSVMSHLEHVDEHLAALPTQLDSTHLSLAHQG